MSDQDYQEWMQVPVAEYRALESQLAEALSQRQAAVEEAERLRVALLNHDRLERENATLRRLHECDCIDPGRPGYVEPADIGFGGHKRDCWLSDYAEMEHEAYALKRELAAANQDAGLFWDLYSELYATTWPDDVMATRAEVKRRNAAVDRLASQPPAEAEGA